MYNEIFSFLEWISVGLNLLFIILIISEKRVGWVFGIIGSFISIGLFIGVKLYSEAILYSYYVFMGVYGWKKWNTDSGNSLRISEKSFQTHLQLIIACLILSVGLGTFFKINTDAQKPFADAFSTIFSFLATYLEAQKILSGWLYWICLNAFSVWLYYGRGLAVYAGLMIIYTILSIAGYVRWKKNYDLTKTG